jgi:hypothetical protein
MPPIKRRNKGKQGSTVISPQPPLFSTGTASPIVTAAPAASSPTATAIQQQYSDLVLTSAKRRGVYECDYCHSDISQLPRIRCVVCTDFDLCLDCCSTATQQRGGGHDSTHPYRVCDSTRYPLFPQQQVMSPLFCKQKVAPGEVLDVKFAQVAASNTSEKDESAVDKTLVAPAKEAVVANDDSKNNSKQEIATDDCNIPHAKEMVVDNFDQGKEDSARAPQDETAAVHKETRADEETLQGIEALGEQPKSNNKSAALIDGMDAYYFSDAIDAKSVWTIEEDLRLIEAIRTHGLGNWGEIADAVSGQGSTGKTPKRCMERYFDGFLGRYGHILPPLALEMEDIEDMDKPPDDDTMEESSDGVRSSKRRAVLLRSPSGSIASFASKKRFKTVATEFMQGYDNVWTKPYMPAGVELGQDVNRDVATKAELLFVKMIASMENRKDAEELRQEWTETKLGKPGGPTVLPMRVEDIEHIPGAELAGFYPRRGDFDVEWENDAEVAIADMEFVPGESAADQELKLKVLAIYNSKLDDREKRKQYVINRKLCDYQKIQAEELALPRDERDLVHRMRLFERFHTPEEHKLFIADLLKAKRLRKEIAKLQCYRRIGIRTLAEAEQYELDKARRSFHRTAHYQKETEAIKLSGASNTSEPNADGTHVSSSLWKQYRTNDRRKRKSITRGSDEDDYEAIEPKHEVSSTTISNLKSTDEDALTTKVSSSVQADLLDVDSVLPSKISDETVVTISSKQEVPDSLSLLPGFNLLSSREVELCRRLELTPKQYQEIKKALILESLAQGLLDETSHGSNRRTLVKIDVLKRGSIVDFMASAGWISTKLTDTIEENFSSMSAAKVVEQANSPMELEDGPATATPLAKARPPMELFNEPL